jgi:peptidoglycan/LPS O-acetylase OafA/YrhL
MQSPKPGVDLAALTGLRFFLALAVYISHVPPPAGSPEIVATVMASGYYGVTFFFVLSGFVLAYNYWDRLAGKRDLWDFAVARFARVYPLYIVVLLFVATRIGGSPELVLHALALQQWHPDLLVAYAYNAPGWSIGVEFFLYATLPFLLLLVALAERRRALVWLAAGVALVMLALATWFIDTGRSDLPWTDPESAHRWLYRTPLTRVGDFLLGVVAARLYIGWRRGTRPGTLMIYGALIAALVLAMSPEHIFSAYSWDVSYAIPAFVLILGLALVPRNPVARVLAHPKVVLLGEASFALYLIHWWMKNDLGSGAWTVWFGPRTIAQELGILAIVTATAIGIHLYFERPARTLVRTAVANLEQKGQRLAARRQA